MRNTKESGITLIALIITIIVMLILVGVTVAVALNGGLFSTAKNAAKGTQVEADREELLSAVVSAFKTDGTVDFSKLPPSGWTGTNGTYTSPKGNTFKVKADGTVQYNEPGAVIHGYYYDETDPNKIKCTEHADEEYTIGAEYAYTPSTAETVAEISATDSGVTRAIANGDITATDLAEYGYDEETAKQTITQENLTWIVLGIDKQDTNKLLIASAEPTTQMPVLYGAESYTNGPDIINNVCETLYSNEDVNALARGMTIEDVNEFLGFELPEGKTGMCYNGNEEVWVSGNLKDLPTKYVSGGTETEETVWSKIEATAREGFAAGYSITPGGEVIPNGEGVTDEEKRSATNSAIEVLGNYPVDGYYYTEEQLSTTEARKNIIFGEIAQGSSRRPWIYYLASRGVNAGSDSSGGCAYFGPGLVVDGRASSCYDLFRSSGTEDYVAIGARPVVSMVPSP